jgi:hypothetical protein
MFYHGKCGIKRPCGPSATYFTEKLDITGLFTGLSHDGYAAHILCLWLITRNERCSV